MLWAVQSSLSSAGRRLLQPPQLPSLPGLPGSGHQQQQASSTIAATSTLASQASSGGLLVLAQIQTSSADAQLMLDTLNRAASNGQLLSALTSHGACMPAPCACFRPPWAPAHKNDVCMQ